MRAAGGSRIELHEIPTTVRTALAELLGSAIVEADNQPGGFSPGLAARCALADGRRVFIKAVSPDQNPDSARIHRREIHVASQLPAAAPAPRLLHTHDDGEWVALVFEEVEGRQPIEPWTLEALDLVIPAIRSYHEIATPTPIADLQPAELRYDAMFRGWRRLAADDGEVEALPAWCRDRLPRLAELEEGWAVAVTGDTLLHTDLRADNMLVGDGGQVTFVDWPWACIGAAFLDPVLMLPSIGLGGGLDPRTVIERYGLDDGVEPEAFVSVFVAMSGFLVRAAQDPAPPGLPTLREFQRAQGDVTLTWLETVLA